MLGIIIIIIIVIIIIMNSEVDLKVRYINTNNLKVISKS